LFGVAFSLRGTRAKNWIVVIVVREINFKIDFFRLLVAFEKVLQIVAKIIIIMRKE
jgi:hypothetical protein